MRNFQFLLASLMISLLAGCAWVQKPGQTPTPDLKTKIQTVKGDITAHDPTLMKAGKMYYRFVTGVGIPIACSSDRVTWAACGRVFLAKPAWTIQEVPGVAELWAPDIAFFNGKYHLYYSASTFGSNLSVIGLATTPTLDQSSPDYAWQDEGLVVKSTFSDNFNAIDPNIVLDPQGQPWLAYGSFWSGIKLRRLDPQTGKPPQGDTEVIDLASRPEDPHAIEAAFILPRSGEFFLFVSFDQCCQGANSTYNIRVGRASAITGPYLDREGKKMLEGGGTLLLDGKTRWRGPGHNSILIDEGVTYLVYHAYDAEHAGTPVLHIEELLWDKQGWPAAPSQTVGE